MSQYKEVERHILGFARFAARLQKEHPKATVTEIAIHYLQLVKEAMQVEETHVKQSAGEASPSQGIT